VSGETLPIAEHLLSIRPVQGQGLTASEVIGSLLVEIDPYGQQISAQRAHHRAVEARQCRQTGIRIITRQYEGGSCVPAAPDANANPVVRLDVSNIIRRFAVVGHQPERGAVEAPADWCASRLPADAARRLQQDLGG
jgi:hypothetical protein